MAHAFTIVDSSASAASAGNEPEAARRRRDVQYPASLAQRRFWVLDQLEPHNSAMNVAVRWRIEGDLSAQLIEQAFREIVERHETLRTYFVEVDGEPIQAVQSKVSFRVPSIDLTTRPESEAVAECDRIAQLEATTPFNLSIAPLIRVTHVRLRSDVAIVLVTAHHAVCDGWSIGVLAREMGVIAAALQSGRQHDLPDLPIAYGDYSAWQRQAIADDGLEPEVAYWSRALAGFEFFEMPTDFPRRSSPGSRGAIQSQLLDRELMDRVTAVAREKGCTLFMLSYAVLLMLLQRYTGATDISVGTQVAGRDQVETEDLVGVFINTLILRADLSGDPSFAVLLHRARDVIVQALENEAIPLEMVLEILRLQRRSAHNGLFSVNFIYQRSFIENVDYGPFKLVDLPSRSAGALYDLNFFMVERPEGWRFSCEYRADLFEADTIGRMLGHYRTLLEGVASDPDRRLYDFPLLTDDEFRRVVVDWNETERAYPNDRCLHQLIEEHANRTPEATAVVFKHGRLTYRDLDERANRLALRLRRLGVGPDKLVAVCLERSLEMVVALLAVSKAGGAYVPLDPAYPRERLAYMLADAGPVVILTQEGLRRQINEVATDTKILCVDADREPPLLESSETLTPSADPENLAYVIYTSGSTGRPKGVEIQHRSLLNLLTAMADELRFGRNDKLLALTTISFDIAGLEIFLPLVAGGQVEVVPTPDVRDAAALRRRIERSGATVIQATPATWTMLIDAGWTGDKGLTVLTGGEALPFELAEGLAERAGAILNVYGPTETTIWSTLDRRRAGAPITIGRPIANTQVYILDSHLQPTPIGVPGELHIGGAGLARGYRNHPDLTAEKFIRNPFRSEPGARIYKTGDLARYLPDGTIECLGRLDYQVKIHGFRIELGEVESALGAQPAIREAVALAREDSPGDKRLVAYLTAKEGQTIAESEIREGLLAKLPDYMIPSAFVVLDRLPLTPNGKIDRKALPRPQLPGGSKTSSSELTDDIEIRLAQLWRDILKVDSVDGNSDFFELGGHSLLAARLLARVESVFGRRISMSTLFDARTLAVLANQIRSRHGRDFDFRQVVRMGVRDAKKQIFAIHNSGIFMNLAKRLDGDTSITAVQLFDPKMQKDNFPATLEETAAQYVRLIREICPTGPYTLLGWCNGGALAFETARQLWEMGEEISHLFIVDAWIPGYMRRLGWLRGKLSDYNYRWQQILGDWSRARSGEKSYWNFVADRSIFRFFVRRKPDSPALDDPSFAVAQAYDQWLLGYTSAMLKAYHPKPINAPITVFRSTFEPVGLFLDPKMGWGGMGEKVDVVFVPGDHHSIFQEPGVSIIAKHIEVSIQSEDSAAIPASKIILGQA